jgi:hypothetical protein
MGIGRRHSVNGTLGSDHLNSRWQRDPWNLPLSVMAELAKADTELNELLGRLQRLAEGTAEGKGALSMTEVRICT